MDYKIDGNVGILTIDRPKALNALNAETIREIGSVLDEVKSNEETRCLIVTGAGEKAFVAGADIGEVRDLGLKDGFDAMRIGQQLCTAVETLGIPSIAAVNGLALGGGCELAMSCSLRLVSENAKFGLPELGLGVIPGYGGTQKLARLIGKGRALWYLLTGDMIDAEKAVETGLANLMVSQGELMEKSLEVAKKICTKAPLAVKSALCAVKYGLETDQETGLVLEAMLCNLTLASEDKSEGIASFFDKRKPEYKGR